MKTTFKLSALLLLLTAFSGCAARKQAGDGAAVSAALYEQACKALDKRDFIIEGSEFYLPGKKSPVKSSSGSYISMHGDRAVIRLSPNLFSRVHWESLDIEDDSAELSEPEYKKNGDLCCRLKIRGVRFGQEREVSMTLFKDTNKCFVRINDERAGYDTNIIDFTGYLYPARD